LGNLSIDNNNDTLSNEESYININPKDLTNIFSNSATKNRESSPSLIKSSSFCHNYKIGIENEKRYINNDNYINNKKNENINNYKVTIGKK